MYFIFYCTQRTYPNTLCHFISRFKAHWSIQGMSLRSATASGSILTIGGCGKEDCCSRRDDWRQWSASVLCQLRNLFIYCINSCFHPGLPKMQSCIMFENLLELQLLLLSFQHLVSSIPKGSSIILKNGSLSPLLLFLFGGQL